MDCPRCQTDNPPGARFCLNCGTPLPVRCPNCAATLPAGARFCMSCGQALRAATAADDARHTRLAAAAPAPLIDKVRAAGHLSGERRLVTILFADVVGSTALADRLDAETWAAVMNRAFDRLAPAVYRYEGTIARLLGDSLLAFFGAPVAHEDDPVRAVRAALDLIAAARELAATLRQAHGVEFAIRACLNTGSVVVGAVGTDLKYEYTAMGGAVNLATRLKFAAEPMSVLITEHTHRFVAPLFDCDDLGPIQIPGKAEPVRIYRVRGARAVPERVRGLEAAGLESPMVGREVELSTLVHLCATVRAGLGRAVLIVGEPGIGKSRLIAEWKARAGTANEGRPTEAAAPSDAGRQTSPEGLYWAEGHCLSYGQGLAYHLLADLVRSLIRVRAAADEPETQQALKALLGGLPEAGGAAEADLYPYLAHLLSLPLAGPALEQVERLDAEALQAQYLAALRKLFVALAARHPLVLILEDLHWADPSSTELLIKLLPLALTARILFCLVSRLEPETPGWKLVDAARQVMGAGLTELSLAALSPADSQRMVANLLEVEALPERMRTVILDKAEGNPLFVEEVIRMLVDRGIVVRRGDQWVMGAEIEAAEIPDNLQGLLIARVDRLPDEVKNTLRVASVIGRQFPVRILAEVLEREGAP